MADDLGVCLRFPNAWPTAEQFRAMGPRRYRFKFINPNDLFAMFDSLPDGSTVTGLVDGESDRWWDDMGESIFATAVTADTRQMLRVIVPINEIDTFDDWTALRGAHVHRQYRLWRDSWDCRYIKVSLPSVVSPNWKEYLEDMVRYSVELGYTPELAAIHPYTSDVDGRIYGRSIAGVLSEALNIAHCPLVVDEYGVSYWDASEKQIADNIRDLRFLARGNLAMLESFSYFGFNDEIGRADERDVLGTGYGLIRADGSLSMGWYEFIKGFVTVDDEIVVGSGLRAMLDEDGEQPIFSEDFTTNPHWSFTVGDKGTEYRWYPALEKGFRYPSRTR